MRKPDFFIVGAPRCGTTALWSWLRQHPDVFLPLRKEPRFFAVDLDSGSPREARYFVRSEEAYLRLFEPAGAARRVGEATALYLYSREAARRIHDFCDDARILILLRNPVDLMHAFHAERYANGNEDIEDFADALDAEEARRRGERIPPRGHIPAALQYRDVARLSPQVERYRAVFGPDRVRLFLLDDLAADPRGVYREVLRFLAVDEGFEPSFEVVNPSKRVRSVVLRNAVERPSAGARLLARRVVPLGAREAIKRRIRSWNVVRAPRSALDPALRRSLLDEFAPEIERLEELTGRDLSHWRRG